MQTISVLSRKGGAGKTTVSVNLGLAAMQLGSKVVVADIDPQRSAAEVLRDRPEAKSLLIETTARKLPLLQDTCIRHGCDLLIIDTPPAPEADIALAVQAADLCLAVVRPTRLDIAAVKQTLGLLRHVRARALVVLNQCPSAWETESDLVAHAVEALRNEGVPLANTQLRANSAYQRAFAENQSVTEWRPDSEAAVDVLRLLAEAQVQLESPELGLERLTKLTAETKLRAQTGSRPPRGPLDFVQGLLRQMPSLAKSG
jgi:chromosome partitioning protein